MKGYKKAPYMERLKTNRWAKGRDAARLKREAAADREKAAAEAAAAAEATEDADEAAEEPAAE